jgi:hypothetical protein
MLGITGRGGRAPPCRLDGAPQRPGRGLGIGRGTDRGHDGDAGRAAGDGASRVAEADPANRHRRNLRAADERGQPLEPNRRRVAGLGRGGAHRPGAHVVHHAWIDAREMCWRLD